MYSKSHCSIDIKHVWQQWRNFLHLMCRFLLYSGWWIQNEILKILNLCVVLLFNDFLWAEFVESFFFPLKYYVFNIGRSKSLHFELYWLVNFEWVSWKIESFRCYIIQRVYELNLVFFLALRRTKVLCLTLEWIGLWM